MTPAAGGRDAARPPADAPMLAVALPAVGAVLCLGLVAVALAGLLSGVGRRRRSPTPAR
ncbi:hypothetical protein [Nesterenkonia sp. PF2B19]|uniref:hypothetical protein n=1 Tax=Nesterenkonia sp. PF2B19 TaxID=1881858 RepID=UPI00148339DF|nr:hypothetical protein [Nesterenkonia sp. PF2B19]